MAGAGQAPDEAERARMYKQLTSDRGLAELGDDILRQDKIAAKIQRFLDQYPSSLSPDKRAGTPLPMLSVREVYRRTLQTAVDILHDMATIVSSKDLMSNTQLRRQLFEAFTRGERRIYCRLMDTLLSVPSTRDRAALMLVAGVVAFHGLTRASATTLLATMLAAGGAYVAYQHLKAQTAAIQGASKDDRRFFDRECSDRKETNFDRHFAAAFPRKGLRYLWRNEGLVGIAKDVVIVRMFDRARYGDLLLLMDQLQKTYTYILDGRYRPDQYVPVFADLRQAIRENMYSMYVILPLRLKHTYGLNPQLTLQQNIDAFTRLSRTMLAVLKSYARKTANANYFPIEADLPAPAPALAHRGRVHMLP